jgi:formylglycine-generating enzyme required for sulfatase activity
MEFVLVRGGRYLMGNSLDDGCKDESPAHEIVVEDFYLGKYPVTQYQWLKVMGYNPSNCGSSEQCPVDSVSCDMAMEFIFSLNHQTAGLSLTYRLPAEAEWEYAVRNRGKGGRFPEGFDLRDIAWYCANSGADTHPVGEKEPNELGLYDMRGNIWEWCEDWYSAEAYRLSTGAYPYPKRHKATQRILRGGSWQSVETCLRSTFRWHDAPMNDQWQYGLRIAASIIDTKKS